jgi:retron-type reverse transcriptase
MIEGDIKGYFDNIDHHILASLLKKQIKDTNLMDLYWKLVNAGYVNDGKFTRTNLGVPQGGVLSPLLSNIYLHEFDIFMNSLIENYSNWDKRVSKTNPTYIRLRT